MDAPAHPLTDHIGQIVKLSDEDKSIVLRSFQPSHLKKKEYLLKEGMISHHMRFIKQGCLRSFYLDENGKEHILQLGIEGWWINDLYSYLTQTPARHYIQALEPTTVLQIERDQLEQLFLEVPATERFFRLKIQKAYVASQERNRKVRSQTAEERYLHFIQKYRSLEQRVPQYMIASYLGISPEHLSTLRKNLHR